MGGAVRTKPEADGRKDGAGHAAVSPAVRIADGKTVVACHKVLSGGDIACGSAHGGYGEAEPSEWVITRFHKAGDVPRSYLAHHAYSFRFLMEKRISICGFLPVLISV